MAAEAAHGAGAEVTVYDAMASVGRKFLLAGKGGLNLTHGESIETFVSRYGPESTQLNAALRALDNQAVRAWARTLGIETFVGSSERVFPVGLKAAPLLRRWLERLRHFTFCHAARRVRHRPRARGVGARRCKLAGTRQRWHMVRHTRRARCTHHAFARRQLWFRAGMECTSA